jgi:hypothetical protein
MTAEPLIELGDLREDQPAPDRPRRPGPGRWRLRGRSSTQARPRRAGHPPRWLPLFAVGLVVLLGAGGSSVPRPGLVALAALPYGVGASSAIGAGSVFIQLRGAVDAYDLDSGVRRWSAPVPGSADQMLLAEAAGVLLVSVSDPPVGTLALDIRTGRQLWGVAGQQTGALLPDQRVALLYSIGPPADGQVTGVGVRTGRTLWARPQPRAVAYFGPWLGSSTDPPRLVFEDADRMVEVVDAATGELVVQGELSGVPPPDPTSPENRPAISVVGDLLLAAYGGDVHRMAAFDLDTLAPQWTAPLPGGGFFASSCGPVLCVFGTQALTGLDPATGARRWFTRAWNDAANPLPSDRLLVQRGDQSQQSAIVGAADLRPVLGLRGWYPFVDQVPDGPLLLARDVTSLWTWFAVVDPGQPVPVVHPLGRAYGVLRQDCAARSGYLICPTVHNALQVWRYQR